MKVKVVNKKPMQLYHIVRFYRKSGRRKILFRCVSLSVAQLHCNDPRTSGKNWFDGYERA